MVRAPEFVSETRFYIDEFHAHGHRGCSAACHVSTAMNADPTLQLVNTSAAECCNARLDRIKKSLKYMHGAHGVLLCRALIQVC
ncbi:hypothetical protein JCM6882_009668 [Rhodosporidiobolus microsporus]